MSEITTSKQPGGVDSIDDSDSRLGALRTEEPPAPGDEQQPRSQSPKVHVEDGDVDPVPAPKDNTGVAPS